MTIHPELELPTVLTAVPGRLRVVLADDGAMRTAADVVENVVGRCASLAGTVSLRIDGIDGRTAVDLLAELAWAGVVPIAFSLG